MPVSPGTRGTYRWLARIDAQAQALPAHDEPDADDLERLERALAALADRLTEPT